MEETSGSREESKVEASAAADTETKAWFIPNRLYFECLELARGILPRFCLMVVNY